MCSDIILKVELKGFADGCKGVRERLELSMTPNGFNKLGVGWRSRSERRNWEFGFDLVKSKMLMTYHVEMLS